MPPLPFILLLLAVILAAGLTVWLAMSLGGLGLVAWVLPVTCLAALLLKWRFK